MHLWHKWTKWGEPFRVSIRNGYVDGYVDAQRRTCTLCGKVQERQF